MLALTSLGRLAWIALAVAVTLAVAYAKGRADGSAAVEAEWSAQRLAAAAAVQQQTERARAAERTAADTLNRNRERESETRQDIDRRHRADLERLRQQTADRRAGNVPAATGEDMDRTACEGLAGRDGGQGDSVSEWLLNYAADAARLQASYEACAAWADTVTEMTK